MHLKNTLPAALAGLAIVLTTAACGGETTTTDAGATPVAVTSDDESAALTLTDGWVKAGAGMTAAFGTVVNGADTPVTIVGGSSPQAGTVELHTMAAQSDGSMTMTRKDGGFTVPSGGSLELAPGADHIMLLDLPAELALGDEVTLEMETADGRSLTWTLPVRSFPGAEETYAPDGSPEGGMTGMSH